LRAQQRGLELSAKLGEKFSANGDDSCSPTISTSRSMPLPRAFRLRRHAGPAPVGPHSMALIDLGDEHGPVWVHDGTMLT
jgi:cholesterol oxidase